MKFNTNYWYDNYVCALTKNQKLLFLYLVFNSRVDKTGIYELPDKFIQNDLDITQEELNSIKQKFEKDCRFHFYKGWIYITNFSEHNTFSTAPNILLTYKKEFDAIPLYVKEYFFNTLKLQYKIPIENTERVSVIVKDMVIVIVMVNRVSRVSRVGRVQMSSETSEDVNPDEIPDTSLKRNTNEEWKNPPNF